MGRRGIMLNPFDIWAPDCRCPVNNTAFSAYAFHQQKIEDFIDIIVNSNNPNDTIVQTNALRKVGLKPSDLTSDDIVYIEREVNKKLNEYSE